jgi:signal transduction histidine kinase
VLVANVVAVGAWTRDELSRPVLGAAVVVGLVLWSLVVTLAYADASRRTARLLAADVAVALAALLLTPLAKADGFDATLAGYWVMSPMLACAARWGWRGGLVAGLLVGGTDLLIRDEVSQSTYGNVFLLVIGGPVVGYLASSLQRAADERDTALRSAAAAEERTRLARAVHDGVLQVLALAQRRGREPGGDAELGRLAGEQEEALRALIRAQDRVSTSTSSDLAAALGALEAPGVSVSLPGSAVELPAPVVVELVAAVRACLDNVSVHAPDASAWVLLEALPSSASVSVRDDGPGIPEGRLAIAGAEGRLGVSGSIEGRLRDLGGTAVVDTGSWGTEWTLVVPR